MTDRNDAPDKSSGVSFQLAIGTVSFVKAASGKLTPLTNATFIGRVRNDRHKGVGQTVIKASRVRGRRPAHSERSI
jgi:hypothetical protein